MTSISSVLVANRGEIAERVIRAACELGMHTIAVYSSADSASAHRHLADRSVSLDPDKGPVEAYLDIARIVQTAIQVGADAVHPGYGFLSESPELAERLEQAAITFVGPRSTTLRTLGSKILAKDLAVELGLPVLGARPPLAEDEQTWHAEADHVGYPLLCKASWGGGGRGMRLIRSREELTQQVREARAEARAAFGDPEVYLERFVERAQHIEVQIAADAHGNVVHLLDRDCSVQRRNQKVVEVAASSLPEGHRAAMCAQAVELVGTTGYKGVGTVEFLYDLDRGEWSFIEVNPRIQVEHPVTEAITGVDLVRAQLLIAQGGSIGDINSSGIPDQQDIRQHGWAIELRITTEDPERDFAAASGRIESVHLPEGPGIRVDGSTVHVGDLVRTDFDTLLKKVIVWGPTWDLTVTRARRALQECSIVGVPTNLRYLRWVLGSGTFRDRSATTADFGRYEPAAGEPGDVDDLLRYLAEVTVNGHKDLEGRPEEAIQVARRVRPPLPLEREALLPPSDGTKQVLDSLGPEAFARWVRDQPRLLVTDTTMRDAHQSLLATRVRSHDLVASAPAVAATLPGLFSMECWGGATFDVAIRFLHEDPWERLAAIRAAVPNVLLQMLLRGGSAVGYGLYPNEVIRRFVHEAHVTGIDVFRVFDSLNNIDTMRSAIEAVRETDAVCEGTICYTADIFDDDRPRYHLRYYVELAEELERAGCHLLAIKDMAGVCRPAAARALVTALRESIEMPVHFHTHDTSGFSAASIYAAVEAGVDVVDGAIDSMSGLTSQPPLGPIVRSVEGQARDTGLDPEAISVLATWWESTRKLYAPFESEMRSGTGDVYLHEIPGGQYTNLREQARRLGIGDDRWPEVTRAYAAANRVLGDLPKVTPVSKVVGDLALMMVGSGVGAHDLLAEDKVVPFPDSVVSLLRGELGTPPGGFPDDIRSRVLAGASPVPTTGNQEILGDADSSCTPEVGTLETKARLTRRLYPDLWDTWLEEHRNWGCVAALPTRAFYFGLDEGDEMEVELDAGQRVTIQCRSNHPVERGRRVEFRVNGYPHVVVVPVCSPEPSSSGGSSRRVAADVPGEVAAPFDALVVEQSVEVGSRVDKGDPLFVIEAMKMRSSITSPWAGVVRELNAGEHAQIRSGDLLAVIDLEVGSQPQPMTRSEAS